MLFFCNKIYFAKKKKKKESFMLMLKKYGMLLTINKVHTFRSKVKYMGLLLSKTIYPLSHHWVQCESYLHPTNTSDSTGY